MARQIMHARAEENVAMIHMPVQSQEDQQSTRQILQPTAFFHQDLAWRSYAC